MSRNHISFLRAPQSVLNMPNYNNMERKMLVLLTEDTSKLNLKGHNVGHKYTKYLKILFQKGLE